MGIVPRARYFQQSLPASDLCYHQFIGSSDDVDGIPVDSKLQDSCRINTLQLHRPRSRDKRDQEPNTGMVRNNNVNCRH